MTATTRLILFGGSFDPIHNGHLAVAQHALRALNGRQLIFVPAGQSPHKIHPHTAGAHRLAMIQCAIESLDQAVVSDCELSRPGPSYTFDTIRFFKEQTQDSAELYWLIGADQLDDLPKWYRIDELLADCRIAVMVRAGYPTPDMSRFEGAFAEPIIAQLRRNIVQTPLVPVSSTQIRRSLMRGQVPQGLLPDCVIRYIKEHGLYGFKQST